MGIRQYLFSWQLPIIAVFILAWLIAGGYLLRLSANRLKTRRKLTLGRSVLVMFLGGVAASVAGAAVFALMRKVSLRTEADLAVLTGVLVGISMLLGLYVVVYGFLDIGAVRALRAMLPALLLILVLAAALGVPSALIAHDRGERNFNRDVWLLVNLRLIDQKIAAYGLDPPDTLKRLVERKLLESETLRCPNAPDREVGLFYLPSRTRNDKQYENTLRACDWRDNHRGLDGRAVMFVTRRILWVSEEEFQELLRKPENAEFAKALAEAEGQ